MRGLHQKWLWIKNSLLLVTENTCRRNWLLLAGWHILNHTPALSVAMKLQSKLCKPPHKMHSRKFQFKINICSQYFSLWFAVADWIESFFRFVSLYVCVCVHLCQNGYICKLTKIIALTAVPPIKCFKMSHTETFQVTNNEMFTRNEQTWCSDNVRNLLMKAFINGCP